MKKIELKGNFERIHNSWLASFLLGKVYTILIVLILSITWLAQKLILGLRDLYSLIIQSREFK